MPDDLAGFLEEFEDALYGPEKARARRLLEHNYEMNSLRRKRSLRCWLLGHKLREPCGWGAGCTSGCATMCRRCNRTVVPKARLLR